MLGWGTIIKDSTKRKLCMGWISSRGFLKSTKELFGEDVISSELNNGYPDRYTVSVKALKDFCNNPERYEGLTKNIFGSFDFSQPFDPQLILEAIKDMDDEEHIIIDEIDES